MIAGNETLGEEIFSHNPRFDAVVAPLGGGGLVVGLIRVARRLPRRADIWGVEPVVANDGAQSFRTGERTVLEAEPSTRRRRARAGCERGELGGDPRGVPRRHRRG